ncbi:MAG: DNA translocase FtsK 4TM domain-containing protein, partial [Pirellulales bacterium]|nr:DNA translocase FtsK 4TM domain-containing protein [Pirellulales bacterium]
MLEERSLKLDVLALALLALTVFLGVALWTYDSSDPPSTLVFPPSEVVHNACGRSGAYVAHLLFQALGIGAYYLAGSLAILTIILLARREIEQPVLRAIGWVASLIGLTTLATLALNRVSPGPVIGAGGYLGAVCEGILESNFATIGAYILTLSVLLAGLLLCTDYILVRFAAISLALSAKGLMRAGHMGQTAGRPPGKHAGCKEDPEEEDEDAYDAEEEEDEEEDEEYEYEDEEEDGEEGVEEEDNHEITIRTPKDSAKGGNLPSFDGASTEEASEGLNISADRRVKDRIKSALGMKRHPNRQSPEREAVLDQLNAAAAQTDPLIDYEPPPLDLLLPSDHTCYEAHKREVRRKAKILERTFANFGFRVKVVEIETGPVIAQYEVELEAGLRLSRITSLADDLAIALRVPSVRIVAPIPGKNTVGIEVPNEARQLVRLREVIEETNGRARRMKIPIYLGKDVAGNPMIVDLAAMPHLLIAGRTGTGKSVCLNSIIVSILMERGPDDVRLLLIDPKMVELSPYKKLPHLMHPVVTDMRKAEAMLAWAVDKMEERYATLANAGVRHVSVYNQLSEDELRERIQPENDDVWNNVPKHLPFIVIVADEIADLMLTAGKEVEQHIIRLAQKSRAVGIHLILATQKPTVDVITGLIKSNLPARIAFQVASRTDSRVVLDEMGAERLLGSGDLLFLSPGTSTLHRGQGTYLCDDEITKVVDFVGTDTPQFVNELVQLKTKQDEDEGNLQFKKRDELYESAVDICVREQRGSVSLLQRTLGIGYGRAARLIDFMAEDGIVGEYNGSQAREVLISIEEWEAMNGEDPPPNPPRLKRSNKITPEQDEEENDGMDLENKVATNNEEEGEEEIDLDQDWEEEVYEIEDKARDQAESFGDSELDEVLDEDGVDDDENEVDEEEEEWDEDEDELDEEEEELDEDEDELDEEE